MNKHTEQDGLLIALLASHRGKSQAITAGEISKYLGDLGFSIKPHSVGTVIRNLMLQYNLPICGINGAGYYWATEDWELWETIRDLNNRVDALRERIAHLAKFTRSPAPNHECGECSVWLGSDNLTKDQTRKLCRKRGCDLVGGDNRDPE